MIGRNCRIGRGAHITGCYLLDDVSVGDQAQVSHSLLCDGVSVGAHAVIFPGSVLSFKVRINKASQHCSEACCNHSLERCRVLPLPCRQSCGALVPR